MTAPLAEAVNHSDPNHFVKIARSQMGGWSLRRHAVALVAAAPLPHGNGWRAWLHAFDDGGVG